MLEIPVSRTVRRPTEGDHARVLTVLDAGQWLGCHPAGLADRRPEVVR